MDFVPGQFAMIYLEGKDGWHRHPFTIASAPHEGVVRVTVKALGDYTVPPGRAHRARHAGGHRRPARALLPHPRHRPPGVDRRRGRRRTRSSSWLRALDQHPVRDVDFFYSAEGQAPFADEITAITAAHPGLRTHLIDTTVTAS